MHKTHLCLVSMFLNNLQTIIQHFLKHCLIIILGDFNVDILESNDHKKYKQELLNFMENLNSNHNLEKTSQNQYIN